MGSYDPSELISSYARDAARVTVCVDTITLFQNLVSCLHRHINHVLAPKS